MRALDTVRAFALGVALLLLVGLFTHAAEEPLPTSLREGKQADSNVSLVSRQGQRRATHWAVLLGSSRYFFNYRHTANALTMYHLLREYGIDDDHIVLMVADTFACDPRNPYRAAVYGMPHGYPLRQNLYGCSVQVDYTGDDVDVRHFLNVLQGRYSEETPATRRLQTDGDSTIVVYFSGHAARRWFKFQDSEFIGAKDLSETFAMMHRQRRYGRIVVLADTCHALGLCETITAPNILCLASSDAEHESFARLLDEGVRSTVDSTFVYETHVMLANTSCRDPRAGTFRPVDSDADASSPAEPPLSMLHRSWAEFGSRDNRRLASPSLSTRTAVRLPSNDPAALQTWRVSDFFCPIPPDAAPVHIRYDLL